MGNTNFQTIFQMQSIVNSVVKQATGREAVQNIDMDYVTVAQQRKTEETTTDYASMASFVNNNELPLKVLAKITAVQSGEGDPAPDNVRPITGFDECTITHYGDDESDADTYTITFPEDPGTVYGGVLNVTTGVLTVTMAIIDLGTLTWRVGSEHKFYVPVTNSAIYKPNDPQMLCDTYKYAGARRASPWYGEDKELTCYYVGTGSTRELYINDSTYTVLADFQSAMDGVHLVYELATPVTVQLTPTEIDSLIGENNLYADTGDVSVSYTTYYPII